MRLGAFRYSYPSSIDGVPAPEPIYDDEGNVIDSSLGVVTATVVNFDKPIEEILSKTGDDYVYFEECEGGIYLMARTNDDVWEPAPITFHYDLYVDLVVTKAIRHEGPVQYHGNSNDGVQHAIHGGVFLEEPSQLG